jgi:hypothetical protein
VLGEFRRLQTSLPIEGLKNAVVVLRVSEKLENGGTVDRVVLNRIIVSTVIELRILEQVGNPPERILLGSGSNDRLNLRDELEFGSTEHPLRFRSDDEFIFEMLKEPSTDEVLLQETQTDVLNGVHHPPTIALEVRGNHLVSPQMPLSQERFV